MTETQRLKLIVEAVKYCQRVKSMGMPPSGYTKALREAIFYLWTIRKGSKAQSAQYRSRAALGLKHGRGEIVLDHAIPFLIEQKALMDLTKVTTKTVRSVLDKYNVHAIITKKEDAKLNRAGLKSKMPERWNKTDLLARYKAVNIEIIKS